MSGIAQLTYIFLPQAENFTSEAASLAEGKLHFQPQAGYFTPP